MQFGNFGPVSLSTFDFRLSTSVQLSYFYRLKKISEVPLSQIKLMINMDTVDLINFKGQKQVCEYVFNAIMKIAGTDYRMEFIPQD